MKSDNRWQEEILEEHRRIEELYGQLKPMAEIVEMQRRIDEHNRWLKPVAEIVEQQRRIEEQDRLLKSVAEAIKLKQHMESITSLTRVAELQRLAESSEALRLQAHVRPWLDHGLLDMLRLQEQVATIGRPHLATKVLDDIRPAELAFAAFIRRCVASFISIALRDDDREKVASLLEEFSVDYEFLQDIIEFSTLTEKQTIQNLSEEKEAFRLAYKQSDEKLRRSTAGTTNRDDPEVKSRFIEAAKKLNGDFTKIKDILNHPSMAWLAEYKFKPVTLQRWIKAECPNIRLKPGRPPQKKWN